MGLFDSIRGLFGGSGSPHDDTNASPADDEEKKPIDELTPMDLRERAEDVAAEWEEQDLDFTLDSVSRLDEYATEQGAVMDTLADDMDEDDALLSQIQGGFALQLGSYFGEVLVRRFGGEWQYDGEDWLVMVPTGGDPVGVAPHNVAARSLADEPVFQATLERVEAERPGGGGAGATNGADPGGESATLREQVQVQAEELADFWPEHDLDYTPESLTRLDAFVDDQWDKDRFRAVEAGDEDVDARVLEGLVRQLGCYYGEVLVRNLDGEWVQHDAMGTAVEVSGESDESVVSNVFHIAEDCLTEPSKFALSYDTVTDQVDLDESRT